MEKEFKLGIVKTPALYTNIEEVLNANKHIYEAWINQGKNENEALHLTFQKTLTSPRTADQDKELIMKAMEQGYN